MRKIYKLQFILAINTMTNLGFKDNNFYNNSGKIVATRIKDSNGDIRYYDTDNKVFAYSDRKLEKYYYEFFAVYGWMARKRFRFPFYVNTNTHNISECPLALHYYEPFGSDRGKSMFIKSLNVREIYVLAGLNPKFRIAILIHEIFHAIYDDDDDEKKTEQNVQINTYLYIRRFMVNYKQIKHDLGHLIVSSESDLLEYWKENANGSVGTRVVTPSELNEIGEEKNHIPM